MRDLPPVPSDLEGVVQALRIWHRQLTSEIPISAFSAANPNTSGLTGIPGNLAMNIGSASTATRLWIMEGSVQSIETNTWRMLRIA